MLKLNSHFQKTPLSVITRSLVVALAKTDDVVISLNLKERLPQPASRLRNDVSRIFLSREFNGPG